MLSLYGSLRNVLVGFVVGMASQVPGLSGGVMAIVFGVYERLVEDLADIYRRIRPEFLFFLTLGIGIAAGMWLPAKGIELLMESHYVFSMFLFIGLIAGQIPDVTREIRCGGSPVGAGGVLCLAVGFAMTFSMMFFQLPQISGIDGGALGMILMFVAGVVLAVSKLAPGISGSTVLLAFGLFGIYNSAIANLEFGLLVPLGLGLLLGVVVFAKVMRSLLRDHRTATYCAILGLTIGSVFAIIPDVHSAEELLVGVPATLVGIVCSLSVSYITRRTGKCSQG